MKGLTSFLLFSLVQISFGQLRPVWKPLPEPEPKKAIVSTHKAESTSLSNKPNQLSIKESHSKKKKTFLGKYTPDLIEKFEFQEAETLRLGNRITASSGLVFKDLSTSNIKYLDKTHGLYDNNVMMIAEDEQGLIYIGMETGLAVYNDSEISIYQNPEKFSLEKIRSLFFDSQHRLWIGTEVGIAYIQNNKLYLPSRTIFGTTHFKGFYEHTPSGELFIFTSENGLFILKDQALLHYSNDYSEEFKNVNHFDVIRSSDERIWLATDKGLGYLKQDSLFVYMDNKEFNNGASLLESEDEIWVGSFYNNLFKVRNDSLFEIEIGNQPKHRIYSIVENNHGTWVADYSVGVYLFGPDGKVELFNAQRGLAGNTAYSLLIDSYENIWVVDTYKGISRIDENVFYKRDVPIDGAWKITDIQNDENGRVLYFACTGHLLIEEKEGLTAIKGKNGYYSDGFANDNKIWISDLNNGLAELKNGFFTYYHPNTDKGGFIPHQIQLDDLGSIWGRDGFSRLHRFKNDTFYNYSKAKIWENYLFDNVVSTHSGNIYLLTRYNGVIVVKANKFAHINSKTGLVSDRISFVHEEEDSTIWYGTDGKIQLIKNGVSHIYTVPSLKGNSILDIVEERPNYFLALTSNGVLSIKRINGELDFNFYDKSYGLNLLDNITIGKSVDGSIVIGGRDQHLMTFDPSFINHRPPPRLTLNRIVVNDSLEFMTHDDLNFDQDQSVEFVFNNINWGGSSTLLYRLDHSSREGRWTEVNSNKVTFQELTYGDYILTAYAKGQTNQSQKLDFKFTILPYWYQTTWARITFLLLFVLAIVGYFLNRERLSRIELRKLEAMVDEKTLELQTEKNEVTKQLAEKEILMQEVHHRVKNNLTFLKSLLYLRSKASDDKDVKLILDECQSRIHSMALVHQNLYDIEDATSVDFAFFLKELFVELESMFDQKSDKIDMNIQSNDIKIDMKLSVFLGLIVNEMITNSFKYAFGDGTPGEINIELKDEADSLEFRYSDSGQGLPDGFDIKSTSGFGFKLINILLSQMNSEMSYVKKEMNTFIILIPR